MAYKMKPNKSVMSRFKVTKTGKLKRRHAKTSHLLSARPSKTKRHLGRPAIVSERAAKGLRKLIGVSHLNPLRTAHERALKQQAAEQQQAGA